VQEVRGLSLLIVRWTGRQKQKCQLPSIGRNPMGKIAIDGSVQLAHSAIGQNEWFANETRIRKPIISGDRINDIVHTPRGR